MNTSRIEKTRKLTMLAMLCALAYVVMLIGRIPLISVGSLVLKYDPKDVIIAIGGFIFGPLSALLISVVVSLVEMLTVSETGFIGFAMNVVATAAFVYPAAFFYKKKHTMGGAVLGLSIGLVLMTLMMILWNYFLTPLYLGYPREAVVELLLPLFLPFNLIKGGINMALTLLIYKPSVKALRHIKLLTPDAAAAPTPTKGKRTALIIGAVILLVLCVFVALVLNDKIMLPFLS